MNGIIIVNKPAGFTSHDIVNKLRRCLHTKKVGHAGTLDPDATGVLVVCVNKATKILQFLGADTKEYICTMKLGTSTDTYDASGVVVEEKEFESLYNQKIFDVFASFIGPQKQVPPIYSAIKIDGKKAYEYARAGKELELEARPIEIHTLEVLGINKDEITFKTLCSKGTYIRSLCVDLGKALGYPAHMKSLIRSKSGMFSLEDAYTLEQIEAGDFSYHSIEKALSNYPSITLEDTTVVLHGKKIKSDRNEIVLMKDKKGMALAMYEPDGQGYLKSMRGLW